MDVTADTDDLREQIDARLARSFDVDLDPNLPAKKAMQEALDRKIGKGLKLLTQLDLPTRKVMQEQLDRRVGKGLKLKIGSLDLPVKAELQKQLDARIGRGLKLRVNIDVNDAAFLPVVTKAKAAQKAITAIEAKEELKRQTARENALVRVIESELKGRRNLARNRELLEDRTNARLEVLNEQHFNRLNAQTAASALRREVIEANLAARLTAQNDAFEKRRQYAAEGFQRKLQAQADKPILQSVLVNANELNRSFADFDRTVSRVLRTSLVAFTAWSAGVELAVGAAATAAIVSFARVELAATQTASVVAAQTVSDEIIAQGQAISDFSAVVTQNFDKIVTEADKIALDTLFDTGDIIGGIDAAVKAGLELDQALQAAGASANFAQVNGIEAADAAEQLAAGLAAAGIEASKSDELIDKISFTAASALGEANDYLEAFANRAAASAQAFGYTNDEVLVFLSLLGQTGTVGREAGTQANIVFRELGRAAGRAADAWKKYGIDANAPLSEQLVAIGKVVEETRALKGRAGVAGLAEELGLTYKSISSILQVLPKVNELGLQGLQNLEKGIATSDGLVEQQAAQVRNTIAFQWDNLLNTVSINARRFAARLQPELSGLFDVFGGQGGLIDQAGEELEAFGDRFAETIDRVTAFVQTDDFTNGVATFVEAIEVTLEGVSDTFAAFSQAFNDAEPAQSTFEAISDTTLAFAQTAATALPVVARILGEIFDFMIDNADAFETFAKLTVGVYAARKAFNLFVGPTLVAVNALDKARKATIAWSAAENVGAFKSAAVTIATQLGLITKSADATTAAYGRLAAAQTVANSAVFPTLGRGGAPGKARGVTGSLALEGAESAALLGAGLGGEASRMSRSLTMVGVDGARAGATFERISTSALKATSALRIFGRALGVVGLAIAAFEVGIGFVKGFGETMQANFGEGTEGGKALRDLKPLFDLASDAASAFGDVLQDVGRVMGEDVADALTEVVVGTSELVSIFTDADFEADKFAKSLGRLASYVTPGGREMRKLEDAVDDAKAAAKDADGEYSSLSDTIGTLSSNLRIYADDLDAAAAAERNMDAARRDFAARLDKNTSSLEDARSSLSSINEQIAAAQQGIADSAADSAEAASTRVRDLSAEAALAVARMTEPARTRAADALIGKVDQLGSSFRLTRQGVALLESAMPGLDKAIEKQRDLVASLDEQLNALRNTQLKGSKEFSDQLFALDQQQKQLQLNRLDLVAGGAAEGDPRLAAIDQQLADLQRQSERVSLTESLQLDPLRRKLDETFNPTTELPFEQIIAQFQQITAQRTEQNNQLVIQEQTQARVNDQLERARSAFDAVDQAARAAAEATEAAGGSSRAATRDLQGLYDERQKVLAQIRRFNLQRENLKDEALELPRSVATHAANAARVVGGFLEGFRNAYYQRFKPLSHVARKDLEDTFQPNLAPNGEAVMVGFGQGMKEGFGTPAKTGTPAWYLNVFIPKWIAENKGPISYDQGILVPAGHAVMEGFGKGLRDGFGQVQGFVKDVGPSLGEMITAKAFGDRTATIMADIAVGKKPDIAAAFGDLQLASVGYSDFAGPLDATLGFLHRSLSYLDTKNMAQQIASLFNTPISAMRFDHSKYTIDGNLSRHGQGLAADFSNGTRPTPEMDALYAALLPYKGKLFSELLYRTMVGGNHFNHVHAAWLPGPGFSIDSGKLGRPAVTDIPGASDRIDAAISQASQKYHVELALLAAVAKQESRFNPTALSPAGARGLFQFMPATAAGFGINPFNVEQAADGGARFLRNLLRMFGGRYDLALAGYNAGPGAVQRYDGVPPYPETRNYVRLVMDYVEQFRKLFGGARELGGPTMAGKAYLVGEKGPELHVPRQSGTVIPADQTARMLSGAPQYIDNSVTNVTTAATDADIVAEKIDRKKRDRLAGVNFR